MITDTDLRVLESNVRPTMFGGVGVPVGSLFHEFFNAQHAPEVERRLRQVVDGNAALSGMEIPFVSAIGPSGNPCMLSLTAARLEVEDGQTIGLVVDLRDVSEQHRSRHRLELLHRAADQIGTSLDVDRTTQDLADLLVPSLGDLAQVFLAESVLVGDEPPELAAGVGRHHLRCAAVRALGPWPSGMISPGEQLPSLPGKRSILNVLRGNAVVTNPRELAKLYGARSPLITQLIPPSGHSSVVAPLFARGLALGSVVVWRVQNDSPFDEGDSQLLLEIASRAALSVDNARRFTREHRAAVTLQRSLLPLSSAHITAAQTAGIYRPASSAAGVGGDWFDVVPLSSLRVAFVVGDVVGHGLHAAATMGRLRAAIRTIASLDLPPDEVLMQLDDLVQELATDAEGSDNGSDSTGATCLYALYDPVTRRCAIASAGHPPPALVSPNGTADFIELDPGPPLGVGGMPFDVTEIDIEPASILALYTDGLVEQPHISLGMERLKSALARACRSGCNLREEGDRLLTQLCGSTARNDAALLLARTHSVLGENTRSWEFPRAPEIVAQARNVTSKQLHAWGLEDLTFTTELIVSELVTNAVRYAVDPVRLRLTRDRILVCEVSDGSNTQPRLRRARSTDEGGRGLFLVAQLTNRWGCRYGPRGKTIWVEISKPSEQ
ncbi:SpoIIE family protein phosphatase [Streptomyces coffeae]|uniref:SpoIIE family protein phosphatase n=1 Tax=Streptomyces coffeae TaxID=621382 RepID=A0ABS1NEV1_9ACTN|nr:SpoIIE family protein phosphatase [Streptomyces coffeae]MBL1098395.1 SpoIIE family protein phosphatase [Streptomyces coffeae]